MPKGAKEGLIRVINGTRGPKGGQGNPRGGKGSQGVPCKSREPKGRGGKGQGVPRRTQGLQGDPRGLKRKGALGGERSPPEGTQGDMLTKSGLGGATPGAP